MPWWGWILVGSILLGSELIVTTEFYLVFLGLAAIVVGVAAAAMDLAAWQQWASFAVLAVLLLVGFRRRFWEWAGLDAVGVRDRVVGEIATASEAIAPGATGRGVLRGSVWTLRNDGEEPIAEGDRVRTVELDGITLVVRRDAKLPPRGE